MAIERVGDKTYYTNKFKTISILKSLVLIKEIYFHKEIARQK